MIANDSKRNQLRALSARFRGAIQQHSTVTDALEQFPHGACGEASDLLAMYLSDHGMGEFEYVSGERERDDHSHGWLEQAGLIIDITADQFGDGQPEVLVTTERAFHSQFDPVVSRPADFFDDHTLSRLQPAYAVLKAIADAS